MVIGIKHKEATSIINSLTGGVVPKTGLQHITVGRSDETEAFLKSLDDVKNGHSMVKFWIGDFGSGKSFMLHLLNTVALKQNFVVTNADFTPENRLYSNDFKAVALYTTIMNNISIPSRPEGGALAILLDKWIDQSLRATAQEKGIPFENIRDEVDANFVKDSIIKTLEDLFIAGGFVFGSVVLKYYQGYIKDDVDLCRNALKWLKGEYRSRAEAKRDLGVRELLLAIQLHRKQKAQPI